MEGIRRYASADLDQMVALDFACFTPEFVFDRRAMQSFARDRRAITLVAEGCAGILIGFAIAHVERKRSGTRAYVVTLEVEPGSRRTGVAGRLMQGIEDQAAREQAHAIDLHVYVRNEAAIHFYEAQGYRRVALEEGFYGSTGMDAFVYQKDLQVRAAG